MFRMPAIHQLLGPRVSRNVVHNLSVFFTGKTHEFVGSISESHGRCKESDRLDCRWYGDRLLILN
jgi:hypothetical protein